ncbi:hypothetical protein COM13_09755 [Bacillus pseudomycoides]|uniref:Uncharacterized protein n=1 Tax=Bacillus pseudomycoides TaxID=64104 RepID=A0ABD6TBK7_9BACI|nr:MULTISPECIES: hypothetical protein [Bacillus]AIK39619.1 hypothetical protein DJ92_285 [Bacillus pseudomycoides]AJI16222.1 hypothetical protein BG07_4649 [Bacillus pseudomycoides]MCX2824445.1 hypothetical protein [Bacillus sp. DHT2]MDR4915819.1 hypothetical protein [Bacillus pseudomycoides]MED1594335.1 hypothetical protein [Bacillus pseudomycoides]
MNVFTERIHEPSLIFHSPYSSHAYTKVFVHPMYIQVYEQPFAPQSQVQLIPSVAMYNFFYGPILYGSPFFKHFNHIVKAQIWDG